MKYSTEARVGIFSLIILSLVVFASLKLSKIQIFKTPGYRLYAIFDTVSFLDPQSAVLFSGIKIGTVEKERNIINGRGRIWIRIDPNVQIPRNAIIWQKTQGFLGVKYLEVSLSPTEPPGPLLKDGDEIKDARLPIFDTVSEKLDTVTKNISDVTYSLSQIMSTDSGGGGLLEIISNLQIMSETLIVALNGRDLQIERIMGNLENFSQDVAQLSRQNRKIIDITLSQLPAISANMARLSDNMRYISDTSIDITSNISDLVADNQRILGDTMKSASASTEKLNTVMSDVSSITSQVRQGKGSLGKLIKDEETIDNINSAVQGVNEFILKAKTLKTYIGFRSEYLLNAGEAKNYISLRLQPRLDKYYQFDVVDTRGGRKLFTKTRTKTTVYDETGNDPISEYTVDQEETKQSNRMFISFQLAKSYGPLTLRGGLIENSGGVGMDYNFFDDSLAVGMEAFDLGSTDGPHLKGLSKLTLWKHLNMFAGADNFISQDTNSRSLYVGAGIYFDDSDITTLLTSVSLPSSSF
jgi:phospholipid/cholesterol/gamma-HCH transport system substrate-binding protein